MKTKKGFTIPELLAVIVILGVLITIAIGAYNGISNRMKQKTLENKLNYYKEAAYEYANDAEIDSETVTIGYLGELGYFDVDHPDAVRNERIDNPVTGEYLDCRVLNITRNLDEYEIEDTGKDNCVLSESENKSSEIATKAFIYTDGSYSNLTDFKVNDKIDETIGANTSTSFWESIFGGAFGDVTNGFIKNEYGSLAKFFEWLFPKANAKGVDDYTIYPWTNKEVYILFDFNNTTYSLNKNEVTYDAGGIKTTQTGNICNNINEGNCANVYKVDTSFIFNGLVSATVDTTYGKVTKKVRVRIDKEAPTPKVDYNTSITRDNIKIDLSGSDGYGSGVLGYYFGTNPNPTIDNFSKLNLSYVNKNGTYYYAVVDSAGNMSKVESIEITSIDKDGPIGYVKQNSRTTWSSEDYPVQFGCSDDTKTGCANKVIYSLINNDTNEFIVKNQIVESKDVAITITTPKNTKLQSVTLTYKIYDNVGNESTKAETLQTYIDKVEKQTNSCSGCGCSHKSNGGNSGGGSGSSERPCKGWGGLACVIEGALVGGFGGQIVGAVATPIGSAVGAVVGFIGGAVTGLLCWIFC